MLILRASDEKQLCFVSRTLRKSRKIVSMKRSQNFGDQKASEIWCARTFSYQTTFRNMIDFELVVRIWQKSIKSVNHLNSFMISIENQSSFSSICSNELWNECVKHSKKLETDVRHISHPCSYTTVSGKSPSKQSKLMNRYLHLNSLINDRFYIQASSADIFIPSKYSAVDWFGKKSSLTKLGFDVMTGTFRLSPTSLQLSELTSLRHF